MLSNPWKYGSLTMSSIFSSIVYKNLNHWGVLSLSLRYSCKLKRLTLEMLLPKIFTHCQDNFTSNIIFFIIFTQSESLMSKLICSILCKKNNIRLTIHNYWVAHLKIFRRPGNILQLVHILFHASVDQPCSSGENFYHWR